MRESEVRAVHGVQTVIMREEYAAYDLPRAEIAGRQVVIGLGFAKGDLAFFSVRLELESDNPAAPPWEGSSSEKDQIRLEAVRQWLGAVGYPVGTYRWGVVYAQSGFKWEGAEGGVRFNMSWWSRLMARIPLP
jgi:hypothetical protein